MCYEEGVGVPKDLNESRHLYRAAAQQGYTAAQERLKKF